MDTGLKKFNRLVMTKIIAVILCLICAGTMTVQVVSCLVKSEENSLTQSNYEDAVRRDILGIEEELWFYNSFERQFDSFYALLGHIISTYGDGSEETYNTVKSAVEKSYKEETEKGLKNFIKAASYEDEYFLSGIHSGLIESVGSVFVEGGGNGNTTEYYVEYLEADISYDSIVEDTFSYFESAPPDYVTEQFSKLDYDGIFRNMQTIYIIQEYGDFTESVAEYPPGYYAFKVYDEIFKARLMDERGLTAYYSDYDEFYKEYSDYMAQLESRYASAKYFVRDELGNTYTNIDSLNSKSSDEEINKAFSAYGVYSVSREDMTYLNNGRAYFSGFDEYAGYSLDKYGADNLALETTTLNTMPAEDTTSLNENTVAETQMTSVAVAETEINADGEAVTVAVAETEINADEAVSVPVPLATTALYKQPTYNETAEVSDFECYVGIDYTVESENCVFACIEEKTSIAGVYVRECLIVCAIGLIIIALCMLFLMLKAGRKQGSDRVHLLKTDKIFPELRISIDIGLGSLAGMGIVVLCEVLLESSSKEFLLVLVGVLAAIVFGLFIDLVLFLIRHIKNKSLLKNIIIIWLFRKSITYLKKGSSMIKPAVKIIREKYLYAKELEKAVKIRTATVVLINLIAGLVAFIVTVDGATFAGLTIFFLLFLFDLYVLYRGLRFTGGVNKLFSLVKEMHDGNLDIYINRNALPEYLMIPAENLQCLSEGMKEAVNEAVRQEKTKTELITNVSHDLKTPLTSIINYVDLLKKCDITDETALSYLQVLSDKSGRLKVLIEDLVEASKASTGAINVNFVSVSLKELINQLLGEFEESFEEKKLSIILDMPTEDIRIKADSKLIYRVMENLFVNIKKYSLENTRVYITLAEKGNRGAINLKNISAAPLNITADELKERFVRGEQSRTTEGNGLGLSIAENLCNIQNGSLRIEINGDLFSVTVEMEKSTGYINE